MISLCLPGITVAILGYTTNSWILCMSVLSIGIGFRAAIYIGHIGTVYDIAPSYSGTVYGFVSTIGNLSGFITPLLASALTKHDPHDVRGWRNLFWLSSGFYMAAALAFPLLVNQGPANFETENTEGYQLIGNEDFTIDAKNIRNWQDTHYVTFEEILPNFIIHNLYIYEQLKITASVVPKPLRGVLSM